MFKSNCSRRRLRGDLIEIIKIFKGFDNLAPFTFFEHNTAPTRGHSLKLDNARCRLDDRKFSFAHHHHIIITISFATRNTSNNVMNANNNVAGCQKSIKTLIKLATYILYYT